MLVFSSLLIMLQFQHIYSVKIPAKTCFHSKNNLSLHNWTITFNVGVITNNPIPNMCLISSPVDFSIASGTKLTSPNNLNIVIDGWKNNYLSCTHNVRSRICNQYNSPIDKLQISLEQFYIPRQNCMQLTNIDLCMSYEGLEDGDISNKKWNIDPTIKILPVGYPRERLLFQVLLDAIYRSPRSTA